MRKFVSQFLMNSLEKLVLKLNPLNIVLHKRDVMVKGKVINKLDNDRSLYYWLRNYFFLLQLRTKCCVNSESVNKFVEKYTCLLKYVHRSSEGVIKDKKRSFGCYMRKLYIILNLYV